MKFTKKIIIASTIFVSFACGGGGGSDALDVAWGLFERGSYDSAYVAFSILTQRGNKEAAYEGLGWTAFRLGTDSLASANVYFDLAASGNGVDTYAGSAFAKWLLNDFQGCVDNAELVLQEDSNYVFVHDPTVTSRYLNLYAAYSYFDLNDFTSCIAKIQKIDASFSASGSDPNIKNILLAKLESFH